MFSHPLFIVLGLTVAVVVVLLWVTQKPANDYDWRKDI